MRRTPSPWILMVAALLPAVATGPLAAADKEKPGTVLDIRVKDIDGQDVDLAKFRGKVLLVVNTASQCGHTPQYEGLEALYQQFRPRGFEVLAFPANEFGRQEPGTNAEIKTFCKTRYDVTFPLFSKIVVKGEGIHPLYKFLTSPETDPKFAGEIPWNFTKFLLDRQGRIIARFAPGDEPESPKVTRAIEAALAQPQ